MAAMAKTVVLEIDERRRVAVGKLFDASVERVLVTVDDAGVLRMEAATVVPSALARLYADPVAQADLAAALNVDDPSQSYRKRVPRSARRTPEERSVPLTAAERRRLRPARPL
jgi:hypothetical protein